MSFGFAEWSGIRLVGNKIHFGNLVIRIHKHRPLPVNATIKSCVNRWEICLQIKLPDVEKTPTISNPIGIDMGITTLAALSNGTKIHNPKHVSKYAKKLRVAQRALSRKKRGSNRRKQAKKAVFRLHQKIKNTRTTYLHQVSRQLVNDYDFIAIEDLQISDPRAFI